MLSCLVSSRSAKDFDRTVNPLSNKVNHCKAHPHGRHFPTIWLAHFWREIGIFHDINVRLSSVSVGAYVGKVRCVPSPHQKQYNILIIIYNIIAIFYTISWLKFYRRLYSLTCKINHFIKTTKSFNKVFKIFQLKLAL